jgi:hypothetical protein
MSMVFCVFFFNDKNVLRVNDLIFLNNGHNHVSHAVKNTHAEVKRQGNWHPKKKNYDAYSVENQQLARQCGFCDSFRFHGGNIACNKGSVKKKRREFL